MNTLRINNPILFNIDYVSAYVPDPTQSEQTLGKVSVNPLFSQREFT